MSADQIPVTHSDTPETIAQLAVAEARVELLTTQLGELRTDRDAWRAQAQKLASEGRAASLGLFDRLERIFRRRG